MRRASILSTALLAALGVSALAGGAAAQSAGEARGLRYLSWSGRGPVAAPAEAAPTAAAPARRDLRRPNTVIPHGGFAVAEPAPPAPPGLAPAAGARRTLTPANAWMQPRALPPEPTPPPAPAPAPTELAPPPPAPHPTPDYLPDQGWRGQPVPAEIVHPSPAAAPAADPPADPMAPRRDALIFRMGEGAPAPAAPGSAERPRPTADAAADAPRPRRVAEVANTGERPPRQSARYYSVHRQNGREPDALEMPDPTYVDAIAVTMVETLASQDLAEPEQGPTLIRDAQGRVRPAPAASDGDHQ